MSIKTSICIFFIFFLFIKNSFSQDQAKYDNLTKEAHLLYKTKKYRQSAMKYEEALAFLGNRSWVYDHYNAACSWALVPKIDSSFIHLFKIANDEHFTGYQDLISDTDLTILHTDKRWQEVINLVKKNKAKEEINWDRPLMTLLDTIHQDDQQYRQQLRGLRDKYGANSKEIKAHWKTILSKDSMNLIKVRKILDTRGWLGTEVVGQKGNQALFLVIQHANLKTKKNTFQ